MELIAYGTHSHGLAFDGMGFGFYLNREPVSKYSILGFNIYGNEERAELVSVSMIPLLEWDAEDALEEFGGEEFEFYGVIPDWEAAFSEPESSNRLGMIQIFEYASRGSEAPNYSVYFTSEMFNSLNVEADDFVRIVARRRFGQWREVLAVSVERVDEVPEGV